MRLRRPTLPSLILLAAVTAEVNDARAERAPTAVLWMGGSDGAKVAAQADAALAGSSTLAPAGDADAKRLLIEGGPATRVRERVAAGRERFAALRDLPEADALLAEAEGIALAELPVAEACPPLLEIARLRLRFAELTRDEERAVHATWLLRACLRPPAAPTPDDAAALSRRPPAALQQSAPLRVESDPPGADVYVDLVPAGQTPLALSPPRRAGALLDVERAGSRKAHRVLDGAAAGTLSVALGRDDGLTSLVDRVRAAADARPADVVELSRRLGATQLVALRAGREGFIDARLFDVSRGAWVKPAAEIKAPAGAPLDAAALLAYLEPLKPGVPGGATPAALAAAPSTSPAPGVATVAPGAGARPPEEPVPAWKRWYTWVIGGALVAGVGAYVIAGHVGDDQITVHVTH